MKRITRRRKRRKGFTLIELMTAIFIIALLMSITVPVYKRTVYRTELTACQHNLRNLATAINQYHTENKKYPDTLNEVLKEGILNSMPQCPVSDSDTYSAGYSFNNTTGEFTVYCSGNNHEVLGYSANEPYFTLSEGVGP